MFRFSNVDELRCLGAPVVRLFQIALGHDPDPESLAAYASQLAEGVSLTALARRLEASEAFQHDNGAMTDDDFARQCCVRARLDSVLHPSAGLSNAEYLVQLCGSAEVQSRLDVMRALMPGAPPDDPVAYALWIGEYDSVPEHALAQLAPLQGPLVSLSMLLGDSEIETLLPTIASLRAQIYQDWELVIAPRLFSAWPRRRVAELAQQDPRIRLLDLRSPTSPGAAWAQAVGEANGMFCGMIVCGDQLAPSALYEIVQAMTDHPDALMIYTDEDQAGGQTGVQSRVMPRFKPAYSAEAMHAGNMVGQLALYHRSLLGDIGGVCETAAPFQAYDLAVRAARHAGPARVHHLPAVLYHRAKTALDAGIALGDALPSAGAAEGADAPGPLPLVTVIVPTRDRHDLLAICAAGVLERTDYPALEVLIVDNGSADPQTLALLDRLQNDPRVRVLRQPGDFNFAALSNQAALAAQGEMLVLLNNDVEVLDPGWLRHLVGRASAPGVGAAGAKLLYPDRTVQHAGILLSPSGDAIHVGRHAPADEPGYLGQLSQARGLSAVTGACLAVNAAAWRKVGGMDERLAVTWNDVDLCLRLRKAGFQVVWTPDATLVHHESATRGLEADDPAKLARFRAEQSLMRKIWGPTLSDDPFLNANLVAEENGLLRLGKPRHRRPWQAACRAT